jgi:DNA-binding IscR family transcriptional regulator
MLRLSKKADYALMAMRHLALKASGSASTSAREIAEQYDIPIELMAKVLQRLVRTGLLGVDPGHPRRVHVEPCVDRDQRGRRDSGH